MTRIKEVVTLRNVKFLRDTDKAVLIEYNDEEIWLPLSQVEDIDRDAGEIVITAWIAAGKGLR